MKKAIICDLDGTIADHTHRLHYIEQRPKDYDSFYSEVHLDPPITEVIDIVKSVHNNGYGPEIIFVTGRPEKCREDTKRWLAQHVSLYYDYKLFMRMDDDRRKDYTIKSEIYRYNIANEYDILFVLDDRSSVVKMWRDQWGLRVLQVAEGDY